MKEPPKLRHLLIPSSLIETIETVWEISVRDITWSIALAYLMTVPVDTTENFLQAFLLTEQNLTVPKVKAVVRKMKKIVRRFNPFQKRYDIQNDFTMKRFIKQFRLSLSRNFHQNYWFSILINAANSLKCSIYLYSIDGQGKCQFFSLHEPNGVHCGFHKLFIFRHSKDGRCNFGLPSKFVEGKIQNVLVKVLRQINLSEDEIQEIPKTISSGKNFLVCLLQSSSKTIIPALYQSSYIIQKLSEVGFAVDPRLTDENGFSAFHYCMDLPETRLIWLLYNFAANVSYLKDYNVRNPNYEARETLREIGEIIKRDIARAQNLSPTYKKTAGQILLFNHYQREVVESTLSLKETKDLPLLKMNIILKKYEEYFHFKSPLHHSTLDLKDERALFQNFVSHTEYHENLDISTSMMFFDQLPHITGNVNATNKDIFTETLSSIFLSILSNKFFPKYEHISGECHCGLHPDVCERENNAKRFVAFYYRQCFLSKTVALANELDCSGGLQSNSTNLLEIIRSSLIHLPEIEDEFLIVRIKLYLEAAIDSSDRDNESTRMLTFERTLQVIGEILSNETVSKTVVRFLMCSCLPTKLRADFFKIRHHGLSHYRSNSVQGRLNIESRDHIFLDLIRKEFQVIDEVIKSVFDSQQFRVEKLLIEKCKFNAGCVCKKIILKLDKNLDEINNKRKDLFLTQKENFSYLLRVLFNYAIEKLKNPKTLLKDLKEVCDSINYLLEFIATHWDENSTFLLDIGVRLKNFIADIKSNDITDHIILQLINILQDNLKILEDNLSKFQVRELPFNFNYSALPSLFGEMKDFDPFTQKEKLEIKEKILEFVEKSNETIQMLTKEDSLKKGLDSPTSLDESIMPENTRSKLWEFFSKIYRMNKLHEVFGNTKQISNKSLFEFFRSNLDEYEIFSADEKERIKNIFLNWVYPKVKQMSLIEKRSLLELMNNDSEIFYDQDPEIKALKDQLIDPKFKAIRQSIEECISKNKKQAEKILLSKKMKEEQTLETWYKDSDNNILNLELNKEEHLSVLLKISLAKNSRKKLLRHLNKKMWFLINRINHMERLLILEDETIFQVWKSNSWTRDKDEERHLKSLMVQRFLTEKRVKVSLEMLVYDCMNILESDELADLWKKTNNMFIGSNMKQILAHGNPLIETAGSFLDPSDLPTDLVDKILNLIKDEPILRLLSEIWVRRKSCKEECLKEYITKTKNSLCNAIKLCPKWEIYLKLLPLKW